MSPDSLGFFPLTIFIVIENSIVLNEQSRNPQAGFTLVDWRQKISGEAFLVQSVRRVNSQARKDTMLSLICNFPRFLFPERELI